MLYYHSTQLVNFAFSFSLYVRSTDLRAVSMTCDLRAEQRKRGSGEIRAKERTADTGRDVSRSWRARCFNGDREFLSFGSCPTRPRARRPRPHSCACHACALHARGTAPATGLAGPVRPGCAAKLRVSIAMCKLRKGWHGGGRQKARANSKREAVSISIKAPHARHDRLASLIVSAVLPFARISCPYPLSLFLCSARRSQVIIETTRKYVESMYPQRN